MKYPKISIITPSFNLADYLEQTIQSVVKQSYPNLEYIIIDGGSSDPSVNIIKKYEKHLTYWVSESDQGLYHALQKGFEPSHWRYHGLAQCRRHVAPECVIYHRAGVSGPSGNRLAAGVSNRA